MNLIKAFITVSVILAATIAVLFVDFTYKTFSYSQAQSKADAIVVLAGGKGRVDEGVRLYRERMAPSLFLIGVDPAVRKSDLFRPQPSDPSPDNVILERTSRNTLENAIYGRELIMRRQVKSILLITSRYHMKRSTLLFRNALPRDVSIIPYPVDSRNLKEAWWSHGGSFSLLFSEFYKYCMFRTFFLLAPGEVRSVVFPADSSGR